MSVPSVTYSFTNGTTSDATQINTNFTDLINGASDGTRDYTIGTLTVNGATTLKGTVNLGDSTADDISVVGSIAATIPFKTNATYNIGSTTLAPLSIYLGNGTKSTRILAGTVGTSWTFTLPNDVPTITGQTFVFNTSGTAEFRYPDKFTASQTGTTYTATGDETIIPCAPATTLTITLPAASTMTGKVLTIVKTNSGMDKTVTIDADSSEQIIPSVQSGMLTYVLYTQYESVTIKCNGTAWYVVNHYTGTTPTAYTPTFQGVGTVSSVNMEWYRIGSYMKITGEWTNGTVTASEFQMTLPESQTVVHSGSTSLLRVGQLIADMVFGGAMFIVGVSGNSYLGLTVSSSGYSPMTLRNGAILDTGDRIAVDILVRITGWNP